MTAPLVAVIIPTYNGLPYLKEAVESIRAQTVDNWELIVVDDGSTDATVAWLESLRDDRITIVQSEHTGNRSLIRNAGAARSSARWIAFNDSDDRWKPTKLERQLAYHSSHPTLRWSYTHCDTIDGQGNSSVDPLRQAWIPYSGDILEEILDRRALIALPSVIVERALFTEVGGFNEEQKWAEDWDLWIRLAEQCECGLLDERLIDVRAHHSTSYGRYEVQLGLVQAYLAFAKRTRDVRLRNIAHKRAAYYSIDAADRLGMRRNWSAACVSLVTAWKLRPLRPFTYRAIARFAVRRARAAILSSTSPAA
jgi:glycosyltransferase involved in cell wall biosynthesis